MRKAVLSFILISLFVSVLWVLFAQFAAAINYDSAIMHASKFRWTRADEFFIKTIEMDPFDSQYPSRYADFLLERGQYRNDKEDFYRKAESLYKHAVELNPRNASYWLKLGRIKLGKALIIAHEQETVDRRPQTTDLVDDAMRDFREVIRKDPNGFNVNYESGYAALSAWEFLDDANRRFVLDRLSYALKIRPYYYIHIYSKLWRYTKDFKIIERITPDKLICQQNLYGFMAELNLWQFRKEIYDKLTQARYREEPKVVEKEKEDRLNRLYSAKRIFAANNKESKITYNIESDTWQGKSDCGKYTIIGGYMYWNGAIYAVINMKSGSAIISINAKKIQAINVDDTNDPRYYPYMIISLDNKEIDEDFVDTDNWKKYDFSVNTDGGLKVLSIKFVNDTYNLEKKEDRNLVIGNAEISYN